MYIGRRNLETADMSEDDNGASSKNRVSLPGQSGLWAVVNTTLHLCLGFSSGLEFFDKMCKYKILKMDSIEEHAKLVAM